jgi:hypothetical protein
MNYTWPSNPIQAESGLTQVNDASQPLPPCGKGISGHDLRLRQKGLSLVSRGLEANAEITVAAQNHRAKATATVPRQAFTSALTQ